VDPDLFIPRYFLQNPLKKGVFVAYKTVREVRAVLGGLVKTAAARRDELDVPREFIQAHPWSRRFLSLCHEADQFMQLVKNPRGVSIQRCRGAAEKNLQRVRRECGMKPTVRYKVRVPRSKLKDETFTFTFDQQSDGSYVGVGRD
jgi:hypothetical protein